MKSRIALMTLIFLGIVCFTGTSPIANQPLVDKEKSRQELETMKGILKTTLEYSLQRLDTEEDTAVLSNIYDFGPGGINGFYLYGQGAVFVIPVSVLQRHPDFEIADSLYATAVPEMSEMPEPPEPAEISAPEAPEVSASSQQAVQKAQEEARALQEELQKQEQLAVEAKRAAERAHRKAYERARELLERQRARMGQQREELKKRREEMTKRREELLRRLEEVKVRLKEALASHGDSLTIVKPDESVTLVISGAAGLPDFSRERDAQICHVLSVKKSLVTDLKSGKLSREEFDRRTVDYNY